MASHITINASRPSLDALSDSYQRASSGIDDIKKQNAMIIELATKTIKSLDQKIQLLEHRVSELEKKLLDK